MAAYTTGSLAKIRNKSIKLGVLDSLPKPIRYIVSAVIAMIDEKFHHMYPDNVPSTKALENKDAHSAA